MKKRILFLMSDTGGGHRAAAEALREALYIRYGKSAVSVELVDVFRDYSPPPLKYMPEFYPWWINRSKGSWGAGYNLSNTKRRARLLSDTVYMTIGKQLRQMFREHPADVVVSVHSVLTRPSARAMAYLPQRPPLMVVVTDLVSTHHFWYDKTVERCLVPTQEAYERGLSAGLKPDQLRITGLPVHPDFVQGLTSQAEARATLGWDSERPAILMVGGGEGMGHIYETARAINAQNLDCQLHIIAGRNQQLKQQIESSDWNMPVKAYGFRTDMPVFMAATDILITKAGPATITEACIAGVPMILYDAIPGQETGNVEFVVRNDAGVFAPDPQNAANTLKQWLSEGKEGLMQRSERAKRLGRPNAVFDIADEVWNYANHGPIPMGPRNLWNEITDLTKEWTDDLRVANSPSK